MKLEAQAREQMQTYLASKRMLKPSEVCEQIVASLDALDAVLAKATADQAAARPAPGEWSAAEVVDHLIETHRPAVDELRCVLAGQQPPGPPVAASLQSKAPRLRPWPWLLDEIRRVHRDVVDLIAALPPDFDTDARVPTVLVVNATDPDGTFRTVEWIEDIDWKAYAFALWRLHVIDHMKQARKALAAAA
jgi:hypothetical protein